HAPGTLDHDAVELDVYQKVCANRPLLYASKGALGHGLGASGLVSLVIACLSARAAKIPPMPWLDEPLDSPLLTRPHENADVTTPAIFAAGFGGHVAGAVIRHASRGL